MHNLLLCKVLKIIVSVDSKSKHSHFLQDPGSGRECERQVERWSGSGGARETKACGGSALGVSTAAVSGVKKVVARVFPDRLLRGTENIRVVGYVLDGKLALSHTVIIIRQPFVLDGESQKYHFSCELQLRCRARES